MKTPTSRKFALTAALLSFVFAFSAPVVRAEDHDAKPEGKKPSKKMLEKYDTNKDGKIDDAEKAAMDADKAKAKAEKAERKAKKKAEQAEAAGKAQAPEAQK